MSGNVTPLPVPNRTLELLLSTYAELYRQEVAAQEDVHRTLPFFATALGVVIAGIAYGASHLPRWADRGALWPILLGGGLLAGAVLEAALVLLWISRAIARRDSQRVGPEAELRRRVDDLRADHLDRGMPADFVDQEVARELRSILLASYESATAVNRALNQARYRDRAIASSHLVRSLFLALTGTSVIFVCDKLGVLGMGG